MLKLITGALAVLAMLAPAWADDASGEAASTNQFKSTVQEYNAAKREARTQEQANDVDAKFAEKFLSIAQDTPKDPESFQAAEWIVLNLRSGAALDKAVALLKKHHASSDELARLAQSSTFGRRPSMAQETLLRTVMDNHPKRETKAQATLALANLVKSQRQYADYMKTNEEVAKQIVQVFGKPYSESLKKLDDKQAAAKLESLFERIQKDFADVSTGRGTMGEMAKSELYELRNLAIGKIAPDIKGEDIDGVQFKLSDYRGKVVVLDFWGHW